MIKPRLSASLNTLVVLDYQLVPVIDTVTSSIIGPFYRYKLTINKITITEQRSIEAIKASMLHRSYIVTAIDNYIT